MLRRPQWMRAETRVPARAPCGSGPSRVTIASVAVWPPEESVDNLYFSATGSNGRELFRLSSSEAITQLNLAAGAASSSPSGFVDFQGNMYFAATVGGERGLWRLDTSTSALAAVNVPLPAGVVLPQEVVFYALADELYFAADGPAGRELYRMNAAGTVSLAADVNAGPASSDPAEVILFGGKVYFVATEAAVGRELFVLRADPSSIRIDSGKLIFNDDAGDKDNRLVISSTGTHLVIVDQNGHTILILTAIAGATGAGTNQVVIPLASLAGITDLDIGTVLNPLQAIVANLEAEGGSGGLFLTDVGGLELGGVSDAIQGVHSGGGPIKVTTSGSMLISEAVSAAGSGNIELIASGDISVAAHVTSDDGNVSLLAAGDVVSTASGGIESLAGTILLRADSDNLGGGSIQFAGNIDVGAGQVVFNFPNADGQLSGSIHGSGGLVKEGPGTLTLTPASSNTYAGTTELLGGTLRVDGVIGAAGPAGFLSLAANTTLTGSGDVNAPIFSRETSARIVSLGDLKLGDGSANGFDFAGTLLIAGGHGVTVRDADLAQLGILTMIADGGHLTALGGVEVGNQERLAGSGSVSGNIVVLAGGQVSPGASPGVVSTAKGDVVLFANSIYLAEIDGIRPGDQYDQINVQGTVDVSGAVLSISGGRFRLPTGTVFTLIENDDAGGVADRVTGEFLGLREGATVRFGGIEATISYVGGSGNDITLTVTDLRLIRMLTPDAVVLISDDTGGGGISLTRKTESPPLIFTQTARPVTSSDGFDARPPALETQAVERLKVFLRVVDEVTGKEEGKPVELDPRVIDDVLGLFTRYRFPNGRYRIYVQEAGKSPRLILDISIRDGRAVTTETQQPAEEKPAINEQPPAEQPAAPAAAPAPAPKPAAGEAPAEQAEPAAEASQRDQATAKDQADQAVAGRQPVRLHRWSAAAAPLAAGLAACAATNWRQRLGQLLSARGKLPLTRFHRSRFRNDSSSSPP